MCESSAFVIIKGRGFLLEILMKDKQIKIEKTIFYMLLLMVMVYRGVILFKYSFYYYFVVRKNVLAMAAF